MAGVLRRGNIHWADLNPVRGSEQGGFRPILILSGTVFNTKSGTVIALAITGRPQRAGYPLTYKLSDTGLPKQSWVKISQIRTLSVTRIGEAIASLSEKELNVIIAGLNEIIGE
ncbi:MAG: type II toxin-antitoxin system PemK/MazF family toxin [Synergistales bacterium]|nr:type II toxin-antitoxin system PemK/MazF family toxin [Synergistales bacterium]